MAFFGFCVIYMLRVNLSVAIVAMTSNKTRTEGNVTIVVVCKRLKYTYSEINFGFLFQNPDFTWESSTQGVILGSFFYGYIVTQIPGGWLATK